VIQDKKRRKVFEREVSSSFLFLGYSKSEINFKSEVKESGHFLAF
jgi:hypothetical protein